MADQDLLSKDDSNPILGWFLPLTLVALGIVLVTVGKITAGTAFLVAGVLASPPLRRYSRKSRAATRLATAAILVLCAIAIYSISNTDIPPESSATGIKFVDQVVTLARVFLERIGLVERQ